MGLLGLFIALNVGLWVLTLCTATPVFPLSSLVFLRHHQTLSCYNEDELVQNVFLLNFDIKETDNETIIGCITSQAILIS